MPVNGDCRRKMDAAPWIEVSGSVPYTMPIVSAILFAAAAMACAVSKRLTTPSLNYPANNLAYD